MAYQNVPRISGLNEVRKHFPIIMPFLKNVYGSDSKGWVYSPGNVTAIASKEGFHQGDCLASWLYAITIMPFIKGIYDILGDEGFVKFFYDDGNMSSSFDKMCDVMEYISTEGPKHGYILQLNKGAYLLGRCGCHFLAGERKRILVDRFGLHEDSIFIHPDDGGDDILCGAKVLGSYVGSHSFIKSSLQKKVVKLEGVAKKIIEKVYSKQIRFLLLRWYLASLIECSGHLERFLGVENLLNVDIPMVTQLKSAMNMINSLIGDPNRYVSYDIIKEFSASSTERANPNETVQHFISCFLDQSNKDRVDDAFSTPESVAWLVSVRNPVSGLWLDVAPKSSMHTMTNTSFEMALSLRLQLPQKCIIAGTRCSCSTRRKVVTVDRCGIHFCTGCNQGGGRIKTHDEIRDQAARIFNYCGIFTKIEEKNLFREVDPDNGQRAGDISALNVPNRTGKQLLDIRLTSPIPAINPESLTLLQAKVHLRAANKSYNEKMKKCNDIAKANGLGFIPMVIEITGRMHPVAFRIFEDIVRKASKDRDAPFTAIWKYWISSLMFTLQKGLVSGILERVHSIYGRNFVETPESTRDMISSIDYVRV